VKKILKEFKNVLVFYFNMEPGVKWNFKNLDGRPMGGLGMKFWEWQQQANVTIIIWPFIR